MLFDLDGTVLDTTEFIQAAFAHAFARHGLPLPPREELAARVGTPLVSIYAAYAPEAAAALAAAHVEFQRGNVHLARAYPGAADLLAGLRDGGVRTAAVTNRSRRTSVATLEVAGLAALFDAVVSAEDAPALKPDPAPLREALRRLGGSSAEAAMVGDTPTDVAAGRAAGAFTVAVGWGFHGPAVRAAGPDRYVEAMPELAAVLRPPPPAPVSGRG